jgi:hypothetical protein
MRRSRSPQPKAHRVATGHDLNDFYDGPGECRTCAMLEYYARVAERADARRDAEAVSW